MLVNFRINALKPITYALLVLFLLAVNSSTAQESMMPDVSFPFLEKLLTAAKTNYPKMKTFDHKLDIANLKINFAKLDWFNIFTFAYFPESNAAALSPTQANAYQLGFSTSIGTILQKPTNVKLAKQDYYIAELDQEEYNLTIEATVKERYYSYIKQLSLLNWRTKDLESAETVVKEIKYKFEKGEETFDDYNKALSLYSNSVQGKIESEGALLTAKSNLEEIIGAKLESIK